MSSNHPWERANWHGTLTTENATHFVERLRKLLVGRLYTFIVAHEMFEFVPEVRTNQYLTGRTNTTGNGGPEQIKLTEPDATFGYQLLNVCDSFGVWGLIINPPKQCSSKDRVTFSFLQGRSPEDPARLTLTQNMGGYSVHWTIIPQGPIPAEAIGDWVYSAFDLED